MSRYYVEPTHSYCIVDRTTNLVVLTGPLEHELNQVCEVMNASHLTSNHLNMNFHPVENSSDTAQIIVPILCEWYKPKSVLDLGCNVGWWLHWFEKNGLYCDYLIGIDGDNMKSESQLLFSQTVVHDLTNPFDIRDYFVLIDDKPVRQKFDLCLCLEVAEHLQEQYADTLVDTCVNHSDTIFWSAATPGQGGYRHVNEQPHQYWIDKFAAHGYTHRLLADVLPVVPHDYYRKNAIEFKKV